MAQITFLLALASLIIAGVWLRKTPLGAGILSGMIAGFLVSGIGGRLVMRVIAIVDPNTVTRFSIGGTLFLLLGMGAFGAIFGGFGGLLYVGIRRWLPGSGAWKGFAYGLTLLLLTGGLFFTRGQDENFSDFAPPLLGVTLFAALYIAYGLGTGTTVERLHSYAPVDSRARATNTIGYVVLALLCAVGFYTNVLAVGDILAAAH